MQCMRFLIIAVISCSLMAGCAKNPPSEDSPSVSNEAGPSTEQQANGDEVRVELSDSSPSPPANSPKAKPTAAETATAEDGPDSWPDAPIFRSFVDALQKGMKETVANENDSSENDSSEKDAP